MLERKKFLDTVEEYAPIPFWFWNGSMDDEEIASQLSLMREQGIFEAIVHARKGLSVPYLSEEWFRKVEVACEKAASLGMKLWIYDEDNWPSGYAGGRVVEKNRDFAAKCLSVEKIYPVLGKPIEVKEVPGKEIVAVSAVYQDREFVDITDFGKNGKEPWRSKTLSWEVFVFYMEECEHHPAYSDLPYVDLLNPAATEAFLDVTHRQYKKRLSRYWGSVIKGFFTDEPGFYQNYLDQAKNLNTIAWTREFLERFSKAYGYDIRPYLPALFQDMPASGKIRKDYFAAVDRFYRESYFDPIGSFLKQDGLLHIGHLHREEQLETLVQTEGDFYSVMDGLDYSGIDCIEQGYPKVTEKLGSSAQILLGKPRCFSETFGCFSWALTPQEIKERLDLQLVQGVNLFVLHAFFYSIEGFRKTESPPSLFFQNAYWDGFKQISDYASRVGYALNQGHHAAKVAVYYPAWKAERLFAPLKHYDVHKIDEELNRLVECLLESGIDFELLPEEAIEKAKIKEGKLVADHPYSVLILPTEADSSIQEKVREFASKGLVILMDGEDGADGSIHRFAYYQEKKVVSFLLDAFENEILAENVMMATREGGDWKTIFLVNRKEEVNYLTLSIPEDSYVEEWDPENGQAHLLFEKGKKRLGRLLLGPKASKLLVLNGDSSLKKTEEASWKKIPLKEEKVLFNGQEKKRGTTCHQNDIHHFDGTVLLAYSFDAPAGKKIKVAFQGVKDFARLSINGVLLPVRLWAPFEFDLTPHLKPGANQMTLQIQNTKSNAFDGTDLDAGLFGSAYLLCEE
ncbi:MAG: glycosyl hydrolase [bacterium]|nr:glycosyl hydrolase [bacterium]